MSNTKSIFRWSVSVAVVTRLSSPTVLRTSHAEYVTDVGATWAYRPHKEHRKCNLMVNSRYEPL